MVNFHLSVRLYFMDVISYFGSFKDIVLGMVGGMSQLDFITILVRGVAVILWVGMGGTGMSFTLSIGISFGDDIIGYNFSLFYCILFWY